MYEALNVAVIKKELERLNDDRNAAFARRYFKACPGEYGDGDLFRGIRVPVLRRLAKTYQAISIAESKKLLRSSYHEDRLLALLILVRTYAKGDQAIKAAVFDLYLKNTRFINNWDLVDSSAAQIVGAFVSDKDRTALYDLAKSNDLWERRISIMATFHFIKQGEFTDTFKIAQQLLSDDHDLIHKAVGWMLREIGNRDLRAEEEFLRNHYQRMPRVMLRYAIEKFPEQKRQRYLKGRI